MKLFRVGHVVSILALILCGCASLESPNPTGGKDGASPRQNQAAAKQDPTQVVGSDGNPAVVRLLPIPKSKEQAQDDADASQRASTYNTRTLWISGGLLGVTILLFFATTLQWLTYRAQLTATKTIERGSVSLQRLWVEPPPDFHHLYWVITLGLKNYGTTPVRITEAVVIIRISPDLPEIPQYHRNPSVVAPPLLSAGEGSNWREAIPVDDVEGAGADVPEKRRWVYGRIRFLDVFNDVHEYGFAREWRPDDPALSYKERQGRFGYPERGAYNYVRQLPRKRWYQKRHHRHQQDQP